MKKKESLHWAQISEAGTLWGIKFLLFAYRLGGGVMFRVFLTPVIIYFYAFRSESRRASFDFLSRIRILRPELQETPLYWQSFKHFWTFAVVIIDKFSVWLGRIDREQTTSYHGEIITELQAQKRGAIIVISHLGNFEICRALSMTRENFKLTVLMHTKQAKSFNKLLKEQQNTDIEILQVTEITPVTAMLLNERIERGEFIAISGDRTAIDNPASCIELPFLNEEAFFPRGPFVLAAILKVPLLSLFCLKDKKHHHIYFEYLSKQVDVPRKQRQEAILALAQKYVGQLESHALKAPLQWFNFYNFWAKPEAEEKLK